MMRFDCIVVQLLLSLSQFLPSLLLDFGVQINTFRRFIEFVAEVFSLQIRPT